MSKQHLSSHFWNNNYMWTMFLDLSCGAIIELSDDNPRVRVRSPSILYQTEHETCYWFVKVMCHKWLSQSILKMLCMYMYLDTLFIGNKKYTKWNSIAKEMATFHNSNKRNANMNIRVQTGKSTWKPLPPKSDVTLFKPPSKLNVKLINGLNVNFPNIKRPNHICGPDIFSKVVFFCYILTCMCYYIWQFLIFTREEFAA